MREILFRGKDKLGHWLYGGFHLWETRQPCVMDDKLKPEEIKHIIIQNSFADWNMPRTMQPHIVIPETVGQYTGLNDKNGKKIFEGDIVRVDDTENAVVEYDETSAFYMVVFDRAESDFGSLIEQYPNVEIIGNVHDNPELLEGSVANG